MKQAIPHPSHSPNPDNLLTKREVAKRLSLGVRSIENLMRARALAYVKIGRSVRFESVAVETLKASRRVNAA